MSVKNVLLAIILLPILLFVGFFTYVQANQMPSSWRYKMTVEVETPEGVKSGYAVRQMGNDNPVTFPPEASNYGEVSGEAVVINLGERGNVFALIAHSSDLEFYASFPVPSGAGAETPAGYEYYDSLPVGTKAPLGTDRFIKMVTFTDLNDPKSVELVYDKETCAWAKDTIEECKNNGERIGSYTVANRFEELFGQGVQLRSITLEITDEPTTWGVVNQYLPWLNEYYNKRLDGNRFGITQAKNITANTLSAGAFSTGEVR